MRGCCPAPRSTPPGIPKGSMGIASGDVDADGDEDLFVTNIIGETFVLYQNDGKGIFEDVRARVGCRRSRRPRSPGSARTGSTTTTTAGWISSSPTAPSTSSSAQRGQPNPFRMKNQLFRNTGKGRFVETSATGRAGVRTWPRLAAAPRSATSTTTATPTSWSPTTAGRPGCCSIRRRLGSHWLQVRLQQPDGNRFGVGAWVGVERPGQPDALPAREDRRQLPAGQRSSRALRAGHVRAFDALGCAGRTGSASDGPGSAAIGSSPCSAAGTSGRRSHPLAVSAAAIHCDPSRFRVVDSAYLPSAFQLLRAPEVIRWRRATAGDIPQASSARRLSGVGAHVLRRRIPVSQFTRLCALQPRLSRLSPSFTVCRHTRPRPDAVRHHRRHGYRRAGREHPRRDRDRHERNTGLESLRPSPTRPAPTPSATSPGGTYTLKASLQGFKEFVQTGSPRRGRQHRPRQRPRSKWAR